MQIVRVLNRGDVPFKDRHNNTPYTIPAHSETLIPYEAACLWMGDPSARDLDAKRRDRTDEFFRLRVRYGVYEHEDLWATAKPPLDIYTLEGQQIRMVADDPYGEALNVELASDSTTENVLKGQLEMMQAQIQAIMGAVGTLDPDSAAQVVRTVQKQLDPDSLEPDTLTDDPAPDLPLPKLPGNPSGLVQKAPPTPKSAKAPTPPDSPPEDGPSKVKVAG